MHFHTVLKFTLSFHIYFILTSALFLEATSTNSRIVRGKLLSRDKRDIEILANCNTQCIPRNQTENYEILVEYEEESGNNQPPDRSIAVSNCAYACKLINTSGDLLPSPLTPPSLPTTSDDKETSTGDVTTAKTTAETTTEKTAEKTDETTAITSTETTKSSNSVYKQPATSSSIASNVLTTTVNELSSVQSTTISSTSLNPSSEETQSNFKDTGNLSPDSKESNFEKLIPLTEFVTKHSNFEKMYTSKNESEMASTTNDGGSEDREVPKVIRFSVLETELVGKGLKTKLSDAHKTQISKNDAHVQILAKINDYISRISSDFGIIKNLTEALLFTRGSNEASAFNPINKTSTVQNNKEGFTEDTLQSEVLSPILTFSSDFGSEISCVKTLKANYYICEDAKNTNLVSASSTTPSVSIFNVTRSNSSLDFGSGTPTDSNILTESTEHFHNNNSPNNPTVLPEMEKEFNFRPAMSVSTLFLPKDNTLTPESINNKNEVTTSSKTPEQVTIDSTKDKNLSITDNSVTTTASLGSSLVFITKNVETTEYTTGKSNTFLEDRTEFERLASLKLQTTSNGDKITTDYSKNDETNTTTIENETNPYTANTVSPLPLLSSETTTGSINTENETLTTNYLSTKTGIIEFDKNNNSKIITKESTSLKFTTDVTSNAPNVSLDEQEDSEEHSTSTLKSLIKPSDDIDHSDKNETKEELSETHENGTDFKSVDNKTLQVSNIPDKLTNGRQSLKSVKINGTTEQFKIASIDTILSQQGQNNFTNKLTKLVKITNSLTTVATGTTKTATTPGK